MTSLENNAQFRRLLGVSGAGDQATFMDRMAPDFVAHLAGAPQTRAGLVRHNNTIGPAFGDGQSTLKGQTAEGDKVGARPTRRASCSGTLRGLAPTGKRIAIRAVMTDRLKDGKTVEHRSLFDLMSMMKLLGVNPPLAD